MSYKKYIIMLALTLNIVTSLSADNLSSFSVGSSNTQLNSENKKSGYYNCLEFYGETSKNSGLGFGFGADLNIFSTQNDGIASGNKTYTMGMQLKAAYSFEPKFNIPLRIKTGYGYGVTRMLYKNGWGAQYDVAVEYTIYNGYGIGYKYKSVNANIDVNHVDIKSSIIYLSIVFD